MLADRHTAFVFHNKLTRFIILDATQDGKCWICKLTGRRAVMLASPKNRGVTEQTSMIYCKLVLLVFVPPASARYVCQRGKHPASSVVLKGLICLYDR